MANEYGALFDEDEKRLKKDPYSKLFDDDIGQGKIRIREAVSTTPEVHTRGLAQAAATGIPLPVVLRNPQEAGLLMKEAQTQQVLEKYPALGALLLRDENVAKALVEDAGVLGPLTENPIFKKKPTAAQFPIGPKRSFIEASKQLIDAEAKYNQDARDQLDREARIWNEMDLEEEGDLLKDSRSFAQANPHIASVLSGIIGTGSGLWGATEWAARQAGMGYQAGGASAIQDLANKYTAALQSEVSKEHFIDTDEKLDWAFTKVLENAPSVVLSLGGILNPATLSYVLGTMGAASGGQQYHKLVKDGVDPGIAATAGMSYAVVEALSERLPIEVGGAILKRYASLPIPVQHQIGQRLLYGTAFIGAVGGVEGFEEVVAQEGQRWIDAATGGLQRESGGGGTVGEKLAATRTSLFTKDMVDAFVAGAASGGVTGTVLGGATAGGLLAAPDMTKLLAEQEAAMAKVQSADQYAQSLAAAGLMVSKTKAATLAPAGVEALSKFIEGVDPNGKVVVDANVFAQVLEQTATPLAPIIAVAPSIRDQLVNARAMKSDLIIPTGEFLAALSSTPAFPSLIPNVKPDVNAFSQEEAKVYMQEQAKIVEAEITKIIERNAAKAPFVAGSQQVYDTILAGMERAGRFTPDVNKVYATFAQRFFVATAEKLGVTPDALFNTYQLDTTAEALDKQGRFDQLVPATLDDFRPGKVGGILGRSRWTILEAGNPMGQADTPENNAAQMAKLKAMLDERGLEYVDTIGRYGNIAPGVLVLGMAEDDAVALGREFGQESVLVRRGLAYGDDTLDATTGTVEEITPGPDDDYYTTIPSLGTSFRVGIDFDNRQPRGSNALDQSASIRSGRETLKKYGLHPGVKYTVREVAAALEARQRAKYGSIDAKDRSEEAVKKIAKWMTEEVLFEMETPGRSGVGWYSDKFQRALDQFGEMFPELLTDQTARDTFTLLIAITSDGAKVMANAKLAVDIYSGYRETGKIELTSTEHNRDLKNNLGRVQELIDTLGAENVAPYLLQEATVKELKTLAQEKGLKFNTNYTVDTLLPLSAALLGPKLGAFYANLMGSHGYLTMDRWWSRTFNRYRGLLVSSPTKEGLDRFRELTNQPWLSDDEVIAAVVPYRDAYKAKGYKDGTEIERAANTLYKLAFENLNDKPFNSTDRNFMIATARETQKMLKRRGHDISIADIQAILWYYEKKLYGELGTREPGGISYEEAAELITRESPGSATGRSSARSVGQAAAQDVDPGAAAFAAEPGVFNQDGRTPLDGIVGIHFSQAERTGLDGRHYGQGVEGAEYKRVMAAQDERLRERVHFYVSTGQGVFPEAGVGAVAHRSTLDNLYDADVDALGLFRGGSDAQLNAAESAVIDEGYSGYLSRGSFGRQGTVVLLGPGSRRVDTAAVGGLAEANDQAVVPPEAKYSDAQKLAHKVRALAAQLPGGAVDAAGWRRHLARVAPDLLPQVEASGALERLTGPAYLSEVTTNIYRQDEDAPRGQIRFGDDITKQKSIISVLQKADLSTVLHELGHFYLEVTRDLATKIQAKQASGQTITPGEQSILDDMDALLEFAGVEAGQSSTDLIPTLRAEATKQLPAFTAFISDLAAATGTEALLPPPGFEVKGEGRIRAKVDGEYAGDARRVADVLRGTLLVDDRAALDRGYAALAGLETRKLKNLVDTPTELGYRAIIAAVVLNGVPSEVQVVPRQIQEVKDRAHEEYERWQDLQRESAKRQLTPEEIAESDQLAAFMRGEFEPAFMAWNAASEISEASMPSGAMEMGLPSGTSNASTAPGEPSLVSSTETGTSIQSKYLIGGPSVIEGATSVYQGAAPTGTSPGGSRLDTWNAMSFEQRRAGHEKIARGFEAYLFKGKAPTLELTGVFQRVKAWMLAVYKDIKALGVELTPQVEEVFGRWLASEAAIEAAHTARNFAPLFTTKPPGMTDEEWFDYQGKVANGAGMQDAQDQLTARSLRDMQWVNNQMTRELRRLRKDAAAKRRQVRAEVEAEVYQEPVYAVDRFLRHGILPEGDKVEGAKLDLNALREMYGNDANAPWRYLPTGQYGLAGNEGLHPDAVAEMFPGFDSGDALVRALLAAEPVESAIEGQTDQRMLERYGDLADEQSMKRAAEAAMHNEARGAFIATEMNALAKMIGKPRLMAKAAKEFAAALIGRKRLRDVQPAQFETAEAAAAKRAEKALAANNLSEAATEKRNQLVNFYAAKAAHEALDAGEKALRYLKKFGSKGTRKSIDQAYLDQIDGILADLDMRRLTQKEMDRRTSLRDWIEAQERAGLEPVVDPDLLERIARKPFKELSVDELQGVVDSVRNIEHLGRLKKKLLTAKDAKEFAEHRDALVSSIVDNANRTVDQPIEFNAPGERAKHVWRKFAAAHRKIASRAREMDGGKTGLFWELIIRPMNEAGDREATMREEATKNLAALFKPLGLGHGWTKKTQVPGANFSLSREGRIMMVLNMGTEGNRQRLRDGGIDGKRAITEADMQAVLNTLTKEEMDFVQGVWDLLESYKPLIAAQEKRLTGLVPKWIEAVPVETPHGLYRGGYFPAKYESKQSTRSASLEAATDLRQAMQGVFGRAGTRNSYTKARASEVTDRPLRKDFGVIAQHLNEVIHRLSWQDFMTDATRLINDRKVDAVVREHYGEEALTDLRDTLVDLARGDLPPQGPLDQIIRHLRIGTSIAGMGWNVVTALLQPSGAAQSVKRIGAEWFARGLNEYLHNPLKKVDEVFAKSDMMRMRSKTLQREINEILNTVKEGETVSGVKASFFWMISKLQLQVDTPTWLGAYQSALHELKMEDATAEERTKVEDKAIAMADQAVLDSQGGGQLKDLAAIQRGSEGLRLFTNFYSYFNTTYNLTAQSYRTESGWRAPATFLLLFTLPALYSVALKELLKGECDAEMDCLAEKLARENLSYMFGTMVLFRELGSALQGFTGYSGPAGTRFFSEAARLTKQAEQGEVDVALVKAAIMSTSIPLHLPGTAITRMIEGADALAEGDTNNILAPFVGVPKP